MFRLPRLIILAAVLIVAAGIIIIILELVTARPSNGARLATELWQSYLKNDWLEEGRTISNPAGSITTSESQAYTMERAVWENDPAVFNAAWSWSQANLEQSDSLFAWEWGQNAGGSYGIIRAGGQNSAADGDCGIAFALLMAGERWHDANDTRAARRIVRAIWQIEVVRINSVYYLAADNLEKDASTPYVTLNPSYFMPAVFKAFAGLDQSDDWITLANDSITTLNQLAVQRLGAANSAHLAPDWAVVYRNGGRLAPDPSGHDTNFGYDAFRSVWNLALDYDWFKNPSARAALSEYGFLFEQWQSSQKLFAIYTHSGKPLVNYSSYALYGGTLPYFGLFHANSAQTIMNQQLIGPLLGEHGLKTKLNYYDNNWVWFGLELSQHNLTNWAAAE